MNFSGILSSRFPAISRSEAFRDVRYRLTQLLRSFRHHGMLPAAADRPRTPRPGLRGLALTERPKPVSSTTRRPGPHAPLLYIRPPAGARGEGAQSEPPALVTRAGSSPDHRLGPRAADPWSIFSPEKSPSGPPPGAAARDAARPTPPRARRPPPPAAPRPTPGYRRPVGRLAGRTIPMTEL